MKNKRSKEDFENYKLVHAFYYGDPLKKWIDETNYINLFSDDWNELLPVVAKITELDNIDCMNKWQALTVDSDQCTWGMYNNSIEQVFNAVVTFLEWYSEYNSDEPW